MFCLRFRPNVFRHTDLLRIEILKKKIFFNSDFRYHRKIYRLFLGDFFIKSAKKICICDYVKHCIDTC